MTMQENPADAGAGAKVLSMPPGRWTRSNACPACGGWAKGPAGKRCKGWRDGHLIGCTNQMMGGAIGATDSAAGPILWHTVIGRCACDKRHRAPVEEDDLSEADSPAPSIRPGPATATSTMDLGLQDAAAMAVKQAPPVLVVPRLGLMLGAGVPHMVLGEPSSGKTLILQSLFLSLLRGARRWAGFPIGKLRRGRIVHVDYEVGKYLLNQRYQRLAIGQGLDLASLGSRLERASFPPYRLIPEHEDIWRRLMRGADILLIDSLGSAAGGSLNSRDLATELMGMLARLSEETDCRTVLVHHPRKTTPTTFRDPDPERTLATFPNELCGSGGLLANLDAGLGCIGREGDLIYVGQFRARTTGALAPSFTLDVVDVDAHGQRVPRTDDPSPGLQLVAGPAAAFAERREARGNAVDDATELRRCERIRAVLRAHPKGLPTEEAQLLSRIAWSTFKRCLLRLRGEYEEIRSSEPGRRGRPRTLLVQMSPASDPAPSGPEAGAVG